MTNDPGTPGNGNWEINLASAATIVHPTASYQIPQIDLNFGVGDRVQLTYEIPYVVQRTDGQPQETGWGNANPGVKWRFFDQGEGGWQLSTFPQLETSSSASALEKGIAGPGPRLFLPLEAAKKIGSFDCDVEVGYFVPRRGPREQILGLVVGRSVTDKLELDAEIYNDRATDLPPNQTTLDMGGRYQFSPSFIALFMAGRSVGATAERQPVWVGYLGIQILLSDYGRSLAPKH